MTKKAGKLSRLSTCCQLFFTDKVFIYIITVISKEEALQAIKKFAKDIVSPEAIICDMAIEQASLKLRKFYSNIGTTLRVL